MESCIRLQGVTKEFAAHGDVTTAVAGIDLEVQPGEIIALLGPNGAGKTTTIDMILGFSEPTSGVVSVFGDEPRLAVQRGQVSAVLQTGGLLRDLTVGETVELLASTYDSPPPAQDVLARAGLLDLADRRVQACSGGEQQRLRFALALLADPSLLILDEPTTGMDVNARQAFWDAMRIEATRGRTVVFATHYLQEAEDYAQRIVMLAAGRVIADGSIDQIRNMTSGRTVTATLPQSNRATIEEALRSVSGVNEVRLRGDRVVVRGSDSDAVARLLLTDLGGYDLEIESASLEQAFVHLTETHPS